MCGIFGYAGTGCDAGGTVLAGLRRLDYRGYDSWGVAVAKSGQISLSKRAGKIPQTKVSFPDASFAIGHTRWATHGQVSAVNAHPHAASDGSFALAQNGIFENYAQVKAGLQKKGWPFISETDTEVIVRLIEEKHKEVDTIEDAVRSAFLELSGRNTIIVLTNDGKLIAARNGSPLVCGVSANGQEVYFSSDTLSFAPYVDKILVLENMQMAVLNGRSLNLYDITNFRKLPLNFEKNKMSVSTVDKGRFNNFMIKEIFDTPEVLAKVTEKDRREYSALANAVKNARNVYAIGSGTAGNSAAQIAYFLRTLAKIPAVSLIGSEASDYFNLFGRGDLIITPSQSGETADVLEVLEIARKRGVKIASYVNMPGSYMTRISDYKIMAEAGPEICVASTKIFTSQIAWGYLLTKTIAGKFSEGRKNLTFLKKYISGYLKDPKNHKILRSLAKFLSGKEHIFLLAKGQNLQIVKEAMIKIVEEAYVHAHAIAAGDLKHYAITIVEENVPVIFVISEDETKKDVANAISQVKARGAEVIAIATSFNKSFDVFVKVPDCGEVSAIFNTIPLQLLSYYMGITLGHDIDKPRNIAKSVTVK